MLWNAAGILCDAIGCYGMLMDPMGYRMLRDAMECVDMGYYGMLRDTMIC